MKRFLGKTLVCVFLAALPISLLEGMWSDPDMREFARRFDGSAAMWIVFSIHWIVVFLFWCRWSNRPDGSEKQPSDSGRW